MDFGKDLRVVIREQVASAQQDVQLRSLDVEFYQVGWHDLPFRQQRIERSNSHRYRRLTTLRQLKRTFFQLTHAILTHDCEIHAAILGSQCVVADLDWKRGI